MEVTRVFLLSVILVCFLTSGSSFTYKCKWRSPANVRPKHFWHLYLNESHSLALETTFFSSSCLYFNETSEISILWRCGPLIQHVEFGNAMLSSLVKYQRIVHPVLVNRGSKRPCLYYSNAYATFCPLIGDILFKLNPGPDTNQVSHCSSNLTFYLLNAHFLRNKSASFCDYVQDCEADIFAITETWLMMLQSAKRSLQMGTDCFIVLVLIVEGVVLHFYVERVSTYVDCPPVKRLFLSFGLLCSPLLIYFLISSSTLCRQTELNTYGNIVGRRGLEFSKGFAQYIKERSKVNGLNPGVSVVRVV